MKPFSCSATDRCLHPNGQTDTPKCVCPVRPLAECPECLLVVRSLSVRCPLVGVTHDLAKGRKFPPGFHRYVFLRTEPHTRADGTEMELHV